jgi:hypothetical protein
LWALMALCRPPPGDVLNPQSEVGGVVGGVIGSFPVGDGVFALSSVSPPMRSPASLYDEAELLGSLVHGMLSRGKKPVLGDRLESSELEDTSLEARSRDRLCLCESWTSTPPVSSGGGATDVKNGPNTESFMSS